MLGALTASREGGHLGMDALVHQFGPRARKLAQSLSMLFSAFVACLAAQYARELVLLERATPSDAHSVIASWLVLAILPIAFLGMALRFFLLGTLPWATPSTDAASAAEPSTPAWGHKPAQFGWLALFAGLVLAGLAGFLPKQIVGFIFEAKPWLLCALALAVFAVLGAPFFALIAAVAGLGFLYAGYEPESLTLVINEFNRISEMPVLVAIPLFTFAGYLLAESGTPERLVRLARASVGWMPGGLAIVAILACAIFTALTGASGVTIVALGAVLLPALRQGAYSESFNLGLLTTSGSLGMLFVPALPLIVYGVVAQQLNTTPAVEIQQLFIAGILPGLLMILALSAYAIWKAPKNITLPRFNLGELLSAIKESAWELPLPIVVAIGFLSGKVAPSEIAAVTAVYVAFVTLVIRREIKLRELPRVLREAMVLVGAIMTILGMSLALTNMLIDQEVPGKLFEYVKLHVHSKAAFLLILNFFLLVFGMLLEGFPAIVILTPLLLPIAMGYGVNPIHFGIIFIANLQVGLFLPPVGMNLFIASMRFQQPVMKLIRACIPFFLILFGCTLIITYWPWLSLALLGP
jgi:C4-dicarboxylate transporter, DctM subunit